MDTRTIDSLAEYVLCMQHHRWFNMFPNELLLLSLSLPPSTSNLGIFFSVLSSQFPPPPPHLFLFCFQKGERIGFSIIQTRFSRSVRLVIVS